jgi:hypothetical protein
LQGKADSEETGATFVCNRVAGEVFDVGKGMDNGGIPATGTQYHFPYAMCFQQSGQLQYAFLV